MEKDIIVKVKNLNKTFEGRKVLDDVTLEIYKGEVFVIMGGSGCGKSTLLRILTGAIEYNSGELWFHDKEYKNLTDSEKDKIKKRFGMSFQSSALLDFLTVEENVSLPLREHTKLSKDIISIIAKMKLSLVGLQGFEKFYPSMLSGGMKKRVGLARAIAMDPEIVFYDEPTAGLDPVVCAVVDDLILDLTKKLKLTSIVVTHNMESVFRIADRVGMLYNGKLIEVGTPAEIKESKNEIVQQFINGRVNGPIQLSKVLE